MISGSNPTPIWVARVEGEGELFHHAVTQQLLLFAANKATHFHDDLH